MATVSGLGAGPSYNYMFPDPYDFSTCQTYDLTIWVHEPNDPNHSNDTIQVQIISDCSSGNAFINPLSNCYSNGDSLFLNNYEGNIVAWEESTDSGVSWSSTSSTDSSYLPINNAPVMVRTIIESPFGICGNDTAIFNALHDNFLLGVEAGNDTSIYIHDTMDPDHH